MGRMNPAQKNALDFVLQMLPQVVIEKAEVFRAMRIADYVNAPEKVRLWAIYKELSSLQDEAQKLTDRLRYKIEDGEL